jgi:hypothetical protein
MDRLGAALRLCGVFLIAASFAAIVDGNHRMALLQHRLLIASGMAAFACVNRWMKTGAPRCMGNVSKGRQRSAATGLFCANLRDGVIFESWADSLDAAPSLGELVAKYLIVPAA